MHSFVDWCFVDFMKQCYGERNYNDVEVKKKMVLRGRNVHDKNNDDLLYPYDSPLEINNGLLKMFFFTISVSGKQDDDKKKDKSKNSNSVSKSSRKGKNGSDKIKRKLETEVSKESNVLSIETPPKRKYKEYSFRIDSD